ncbi:sn-glycerol-1-phosphate dehydrogenase [Anaerolentibacter hominis]|uniref:sn-glycerol-1-phosphate dehydrogenase n=1 Tax=Anaerolentibacter hominis TaxID=3079009 RepID=UPI0031B86065
MKSPLEQFTGPCSCGKIHEMDTKEVWIEQDGAAKLKELLEEGMLKSFRKPVILSDTNTNTAAGDRIGRICKIPSAVLPAVGLHADNHGVALAQEKLPSDAGLILAVGSGTIHDIARYVAHARGISFVSVPTAASVDGFVSSVAAMTWDGFKTTLPAVSPVCVVADVTVISRAPYRLTASGVSDLLGKYTALTDWKISHLLTGEYICENICRYEMEAVNEVRDAAHGLREGCEDAYEKLIYALILSGIAMQLCGNSRPASGAEHHMSHLWEMEILNPALDAYHGEKVSLGLLQVIREYEKLRLAIESKSCTVHAYEGLPMDFLRETFGIKDRMEGILRENTPDPCLLVPEQRLREKLPEIAAVLAELPDANMLTGLMKRAGCVHSPEEIGLDPELIPVSLRLSPFVRNRLTLMRIINGFFR